MPELPDVEVLRRRFAKKALRRRIDAVNVPAPRILAGVSAREFRARLIGRCFSEARRYGKRLYCALTGDAVHTPLHHLPAPCAMCCGAPSRAAPIRSGCQTNFLIPPHACGELCPHCGSTVQRLTIHGRQQRRRVRVSPKAGVRGGTEAAVAWSVLYGSGIRICSKPRIRRIR